MNAIQMTETRGPEFLRLAEIPDPTPGPGEILIKVESAAVNGPPIQAFPLAEAAETHRLPESTGRLVLEP